MTINDIANAAGLSVRGLQSAFHTNLTQSPLQHLRDVRLDRAREDLIHPAGGAEVREVANRWHFAHLGRFAGYYADRFGETPSRTLRKHRGRTSATTSDDHTAVLGS